MTSYCMRVDCRFCSGGDELMGYLCIAQGSDMLYLFILLLIYFVIDVWILGQEIAHLVRSQSYWFFF